MAAKLCEKCKCSIIWDATASAPSQTQRFKDGKLGWFREDLSKQLHYMDRCNNFQKSKEFMTEPQSVLNAQTNPNVQLAPSPLVKEMGVTDFAEPKMRKEILNNLKILKIVEEEVIKFIGTDARGDKVGMWMKLIMEMLKK